MARNSILPIFIPHGGCPHRCSFCNQQSITAEDHLPAVSELNELVVADFPVDGELAFYGGSFTALANPVQERYLQFAAELKAAGRIGRIRISTHPAYIDETIVTRLVEAGVDVVELGIQSLDDGVLEKAGRGHGSKEVFQAAALLAASPLQWGVQLMLGLPSDSRAKCTEAVNKLLSYAPDMARLYPVLVLRDTQLAELWQKGAYAPLSLEEAVSTAAMMYALFTYAGIPVIRMGLQPTEEISAESDAVLAGPFHPAFGHLVRCFLKREQMKMVRAGYENRDIRFYAPKSDLPLVFGDHRSNIRALNHNEKIGVSPGDYPQGTLAIADYDKRHQGEPFGVLTKRDFLEAYTKNERSI